MLKIKILILCILISFTSFSRFAKIEEANFKYNYYNILINVEKNGSYNEIIEFEKEILDPKIGVFESENIIYNFDNEEIEILDIKNSHNNLDFNYKKEELEQINLSLKNRKPNYHNLAFFLDFNEKKNKNIFNVILTKENIKNDIINYQSNIFNNTNNNTNFFKENFYFYDFNKNLYKLNDISLNLQREKLEFFDEIKSVYIFYPKPLIKSKYYIKYKRKVKNPRLHSYFAKLIYIGLEERVDNFRFYISSKTPIRINYGDPNNNFYIHKNLSENLYEYNFISNRPVYLSLKNEDDNFLNDKDKTFIEITSEDNYLRFHSDNKNYFSFENDTIPKEINYIIKKYQNHQLNEELLINITNDLEEFLQKIDGIHYIKGVIKPRNLYSIFSSGYANSIEICTIIKYILSELKLSNSFVGLVNIDNENEKLYYNEYVILPNVDYFKKSILVIKNHETEDSIFFDPIRKISTFEYIPLNLMNRNILGFRDSKIFFSYISFDACNRMLEDVRQNIDIVGNQKNIFTKIYFYDKSIKEFKKIFSLNRNDFDKKIFSRYLKSKDESIKYFSKPSESVKLTYTPTENLYLDFLHTEDYINFINHDLGKFLYIEPLPGLPGGIIEKFINIENKVGNISFGEIGQRKFARYYKNFKIKNPENFSYVSMHEYLIFSRESKQYPDFLLIEDSFSFCAPYIERNIYHNKEFVSFIKKLISSHFYNGFISD